MNRAAWALQPEAMSTSESGAGAAATAPANAAAPNPFEGIDECEIDEMGTFKYVLIRCDAAGSGARPHFIVRGKGGPGFEFHDDIYQYYKAQLMGDKKLGLAKRGVSMSCAGGGRIQHAPPAAALAAAAAEAAAAEGGDSAASSSAASGSDGANTGDGVVGGGSGGGGGGRIFVYGYSQGYGRADHSKAVAALTRAYPHYDSITFSNDGY